MTDDRILDLLAEALDRDVDAVRPDPARLAALRTSVEARRRAADTVPSLVAVHRPRRWRTVAAVVAVAAGFVAGLLVGAELPRPVREIAHAIGLPLDSPELVDTREAVDELGRALAAGIAADLAGELASDEFDAIADADARMLIHVGTLDENERDEVVPVAHQVHLQAVRFFEDHDRTLPTAKPSDLAEIGADE